MCLTSNFLESSEACPVDAIFAEEDLPAEWNEFTELNSKSFVNK